MPDAKKQWLISFTEERFHDSEYIDFLNRIHSALSVKEDLRNEIHYIRDTSTRNEIRQYKKDIFNRVKG